MRQAPSLSNIVHNHNNKNCCIVSLLTVIMQLFTQKYWYDLVHSMGRPQWPAKE